MGWAGLCNCWKGKENLARPLDQGSELAGQHHAGAGRLTEQFKNLARTACIEQAILTNQGRQGGLCINAYRTCRSILT